MKLQLIFHSATFISLWITSLSSKISDLKLCADKNCENVISYARTLAKHKQNDPVFLSFDRNEIVEITSKSAGSRPDLWGGKIGERKGYFPRSFVREYKVEVSNPQNVISTQENVAEREPKKPVEEEKTKVEEKSKEDDSDETELDDDDEEEEDRWWEKEENDEGDETETREGTMETEQEKTETKDEKADLKEEKTEANEEKVETKETTADIKKTEESSTEKKLDLTEVDETEISEDNDEEEEGLKDGQIDVQDGKKTDTVVEMQIDKQESSATAVNQGDQSENDAGEKRIDVDLTKNQEKATVTVDEKEREENVTEASAKNVPPEAGTPKEADTEIKTQESLKAADKIDENKDLKFEDEDDSDTEIQEENDEEVITEDDTEMKEDDKNPDTSIKENTKEETEEGKKEQSIESPMESDQNTTNKGEEQNLNVKQSGDIVIDGTSLNIQPSATVVEDKGTQEKKEKETLAGSSSVLNAQLKDVEMVNTITPSSDQSLYSTPENMREKSDVMEGYTMIDGTPFPLDVFEDNSEVSPAEKTMPVESSETKISPSKTDMVMETADALKYSPKGGLPTEKIDSDSLKKDDINMPDGVNEFKESSAETKEKSESESKLEGVNEKVQSDKYAGSPLDKIDTLGQQEAVKQGMEEGVTQPGQQETVQQGTEEGMTQPGEQETVPQGTKEGMMQSGQQETVQQRTEEGMMQRGQQEIVQQGIKEGMMQPGQQEQEAKEGMTQPETMKVNTESVTDQKANVEEKDAVKDSKPSASEAIKTDNLGEKENVIDNMSQNGNEEVLSDVQIKEELLLGKEDLQKNNVSKDIEDLQQNADIKVPQNKPEVLEPKDGKSGSIDAREATTMSPVDTAVKPPLMDKSGVDDFKEKTAVDREEKESNVTPPDIAPSSPSVLLQSSMDPQSYMERQAAEIPPPATENQTEAEVRTDTDKTPDNVNDAYSTNSFVSRHVLSHGVNQPSSLVNTNSDTEASMPAGEAVSVESGKILTDNSVTVKPVEDAAVKLPDSTEPTPEDSSSSTAETVTEVSEQPLVEKSDTDATGKPDDQVQQDIPLPAAQPWNLLPATVTKAIIQKLPPSLQSFLEQEPLGLSPQATVLITMITVASLLLLTCISCLCQGRGKRKKDPVLVIREIEEKLFVVTKEKENLEDEVQDLQKKLQTVENDFVTQQSTAESSQTDLQTYKLHNDVMKQTVQTQETDIKKLQAEVKQKNKELKALESQVKEKSVQIQKVESKLTEASGNLTKADEEKKVKSDEITSLEKETERLKDIVEQLETSKSQLKEEADVWSEKVKSMTDQLDYAKSEQKQMADDLALKENELEVLRDCFLQLKTFQNEEDNEDAEKIEEKLQSMMDVSRVSARLRSMEEESNNLQMKLDIEMQGRRDLEEKILDLERKSEQLRIEKMKADRQHQESLTKLEVLSTYFKQKELEMQRELGEQEALKKEKQSKLENADSRSKMIQEELDTYRSQVEDLKREIASAERDFRGQISSNEKKAHENWLAARAAERELKESRHETSVLRQKLTDLERRLMQGPPPNLIRPLPTRGIPPPGMLRSPPPFDRPGSRGGMPPHPSSSRDDDMSGPPGQERLMPPNDRRIPDHPDGHKPRLPPPPLDIRSPPPFDRRHMPPRSPPPYDRGMRFPIHPSDRRSPAQRMPYPDGPPPHPPPHLRGQPFPGQGPNTPRNDSLYNAGARTPPYHSSAAKNQESRQQSQV